MTTVTFSTPLNYPLAVSRYVTDVSRAWIWNEIGNGSLGIPTWHPNLETLTGFGNIVRIYTQDLPPWVGIIVDKTTANGLVTLEMKSPEWLLERYMTDQGLRLGTTSGGLASEAIVRALFGSAQGNHWTPITLGTLDAPKLHFKEYDYAMVLPAVAELAEEDNATFWVDEHLRFNFMQKRGNVEPSTFLLEGVHLSDVSVTYSIADVVTNVLVMGSGSDLVSRPKKGLQIVSPFVSAAAIVESSTATSPQELTDIGKESLQRTAQPTLAITASVYNVGHIWAKLQMGDRVRLGIHTPEYKVFEAEIRGIEATDGEALQVAFETPQVTTIEPIDWILSVPMGV